jgi:hypothetical protein
LSAKGATAAFFEPAYGFKGHVPRDFTEPAVVVAVLGAEDLGDEPDLTLIIDGHKDGPYSTERYENGEQSGQSFQSFTVTWDAFRIVREISGATTVKGQIGIVEFTLSPIAIRQTKTLYNSMPKHDTDLDVLYSEEDNMSKIETNETDTTDIKNLRYLGFQADYKFPGRTQSQSITPRISLLFMTNPPIKDHRALKLKLWVDGKLAGSFMATFFNEKTDEHGTHQLYFVTEKAGEALESIASAGKVRCSLGDMEFSLPAETIAQIKLMWQRMQKK